MLARYPDWMGAIGLLAISASTWLLTKLLMHAAIRRQWLDKPNHRSSHTVPVPRGGGLAFVAVITAVMSFIASMNAVPEVMVAFGIVLSGIPLAIISWMDDRHHVAARWRLLIQFLSAVSVVCILVLSESHVTVQSLTVLVALTVLSVALVWWVNLYNFMDGIDGIAVTEGIAITVGIFLIVLFSHGLSVLAYFSLIIAAALCGFAYWNWAPAKIFMGDVGSAWLGLVTGGALIWMALVTLAALFKIKYLARAS